MRFEIKRKVGGIMAHIPYGYKIVNGIAEVDEHQADVVRKLFDGYIEGLALKVAAEKAGLDIFHSSAGRMLRNTHYLGDEYYPAIIDKERFEKAEEIRMARASSLGRIRELETSHKAVPDMKFTIRQIEKYFSDPFEQSEYVYSLIESEVVAVE